MQNVASIQPRTGLSEFAKNEPTVRKEVRINIGAKSLGKASAYPSMKELLSMNANEEIKTNGEAAFAELIKSI